MSRWVNKEKKRHRTLEKFAEAMDIVRHDIREIKSSKKKKYKNKVVK